MSKNLSNDRRKLMTTQEEAFEDWYNGWHKKYFDNMNKIHCKVYWGCEEGFSAGWKQQQKIINQLKEAINKALFRHKELEGEAFLITQPDRGNVFSSFDDIRWLLEKAIKLAEKGNEV